MQLIIQEVNNIILKESEIYFWEFFYSNLKKQKKWTYNESLVARFLIEKNKDKYSSISHKKDLVFIWTSDKNIWVDIEILKQRDKNLLDKFLSEEYEILWGKNWDNFYKLWTAKESIIKFENLLLDDIEKIFLEKDENINEEFSWIWFNKKFKLKFNNKEFIVYVWNKENIIFSVCF